LNQKKRRKSNKSFGKRATVGDREIRGIPLAFKYASWNIKVAGFTKSLIALAGVKKYGKTVVARTRDLLQIVKDLGRRQESIGRNTVTFA